jgi:broad specificity phosphatase PhoE
MTMPRNIIFIRHGESEANLIHKSERNGYLHESHDAIYARHDWEQRLSEKGIEQAKAAGAWLVKNNLTTNSFDRCYVSTYQRAIETALYVGDDSTLWHIDDRFRERNWSEFGATPLKERKERFPYAHDSMETNAFYANMNGGESLSDVQMRIRDGIGTFHRDLEGKNVLVVAHGEVMTVARYLIERMLPEEIVEADKDEFQQMKNCTILHYSRVNPNNTFDVSDHIAWMRMVYPYDEINSPFGGYWQSISEGRVRSGAELRKRLAISPPLTREEV